MCMKCWRCVSKFTCCEVESVYYNLREGVVFVGITSVVISAVILLISLACLALTYLSDELINKHPLMAINLIFSFVAFCLSIYTLIISVLLLWQARQTKANIIFICSLWYVSHLSILTLYCILFMAKVAICIIRKHYFTAVFTSFAGILYQSIFVYFTIVVNSYLHSLHQERYL